MSREIGPVIELAKLGREQLGLQVDMIKELLRLIMGFFEWGETTIGQVVDELMKIIDKLFGRIEPDK